MLDLVEQERASALAGVATVLIALTEDPSFERRDLSSVRAAVSGGALVAPESRQAHRGPARRAASRSSTGRPRASPVITQGRPDDSFEDRATTVGRPLPQTEVKIVDRRRRDAPVRRGRRALRARLSGDGRLLRDAGRDRRGDRRGRLAAHGRPRLDGRARPLPHRRPPEGHDHPRRREHLPARDRAAAVHPRARRRSRRRRHPRREVGRAGLRVRQRGARCAPTRRSWTRTCARSSRRTRRHASGCSSRSSR